MHKNNLCRFKLVLQIASDDSITWSIQVEMNLMATMKHKVACQSPIHINT